MIQYLHNVIASNVAVKSAKKIHNEISVPEHFLRYLLLIEDKRFNIHLGVDPISVARAFINNIIYRDLCEGASTITQQLYGANLEIEGKTYNRKIDGKIKQIIWSLQKEFQSSKTEIISEYLKTIYWGRSYYGLDQAADGYFGTTRKQLSHEQGFFLAERIAWPNLVNISRIKKIISIPQILSDFDNSDRLANLESIYDRIFQCKDNLCLIPER